jgi:hypothetical protein
MPDSTQKLKLDRALVKCMIAALVVGGPTFWCLRRLYEWSQQGYVTRLVMVVAATGALLLVPLTVWLNLP